MAYALPDLPRKGRGAVGNPAGRFEGEERVRVDDGWWPEDEGARLQTTLTPDASRSVLTRNDSPDIPFDRSINPYRGCEHGCVYCFARPTHSYLGLSPGLDFESKLLFKRDAAALLEAALRKRGYEPRPIALGVNTDAYQPAERRLRITRSILEVLAAHDHPVSLITKSAGILRDVDILAPMAAKNLAHVMVSVTTLDPVLARRMEPRAARPGRRLEVIRTLNEAGVPTGVQAAPMIPGLNDHELEEIITHAAGAGAGEAGYILLRLPHELKGMFFDWLRAHYPDRAKRVETLLRSCRGGGLYASGYGQRMRGGGVYADLLAARFRVIIAKLGMNARKLDLDCSRFSVPPGPGDQLSLI